MISVRRYGVLAVASFSVATAAGCKAPGSASETTAGSTTDAAEPMRTSTSSDVAEDSGTHGEETSDSSATATEGTSTDSGATESAPATVTDGAEGSTSLTGVDLPDMRSGCENVDILLVIDNTGSMAEEQEILVDTVSALMVALERPGVEANYRLAFTTTDHGNPYCSARGEPSFVFDVCRDHLEDFHFVTAEPSDRTGVCLDACPEELVGLETLPTTVAGSDEVAPRPWIERTDGVRNLPETVSASDAAACLAAQGLMGCGFEQPLETMRRSLLRAFTAEDAAFGFMRPDASLVVIFVTDEDDCSYNPNHGSIFLPDGERTFWNDPTAASPSSAVCWNAGVRCEGSECRAVDLDEQGNLVDATSAATDAVLHPLSRYVDALATIEAQKKAIDPALEVRVVAIAGVPAGYDGTLEYSHEGEDVTFVEQFGIDPGCTTERGQAVPPVRLREFVEAFAVDGEINLYSICGDDFRPAFEAVGDALCQQLPIP